MREIHWLETKQLDRVTNFSTETEVLRAGIKRNLNVQYYCSFSKRKEYYGLKHNINYLGFFKNRWIKALEFQFLVILKIVQLILTKNNVVVMVNQGLVKHALPGLFINKILRKSNKFIIDIRTTPTNPSTFERDMAAFHRQFRVATKYFDGLSFITPFMERHVMNNYNVKIPTVNWSSGVDIELFNSVLYTKPSQKKPFTIFYHGGISISRGNLNLIKACEKVVEFGYDLQLVQIGICVDKSIESYIKEQKIESWCKLLPPVDLKEIPQYIANADLPVLPFPDFMAWRVSSPIKLMEYLAMGKKVLAPNMEAFTDVFANHPDLIFYYNTNAENQVNEISDCIKQIIDDSLLEQVNPQDCVDFVSSKMTWEQQANRLLNFCVNL